MPLTPDVDGLWSNKILADHVVPVETVTWVAGDGVRYLLPEIVLAYKARVRPPRSKDDPDFEATPAVLDEPRREWLRGALATVGTDHHWLARL